MFCHSVITYFRKRHLYLTLINTELGNNYDLKKGAYDIVFFNGNTCVQELTEFTVLSVSFQNMMQLKYPFLKVNIHINIFLLKSS